MKSGFIIIDHNPKANPRNGDTHPLPPRKVQVGTLCQKTYADIVLGYEWTNSRTLSGERRDSTMLKEKKKPAIRSFCRGLLSKGFLLLHDNARPHNAAATVTTI
jgi:hypothetical protein